MKVAPVSADLLIKLALGVLVVGGAVWAVRAAKLSIENSAIGRLISSGIDTVHTAGNVAGAALGPLPALLGSAADRADYGARWLEGYEQNPVNRTNSPDSDLPVYRSPMVNDSGMDFRYF